VKYCRLRKGHQRANAILRCFVTRDNAVLVRAFIRPTYVRPVEYNSVVWSPHLKRDIVAIEKVQKICTKRRVVLKGLPYAERLKSLSLTSLELRRLHNDLLWC